ncbi:MAG: hypothetical protein JNK46_17025 [Methylobacteriaceae bacterium]|nr:hypothetical protein [Methylobacteriaceae bacterium]
MMRRVAACCIGLAAMAVGGARAAPDFLDRVMGAKDGAAPTVACFRRVYDARHLAGHPQQNVRKMLLLLETGIDPQQPGAALATLGVDFRKGAGFLSGGYCGVMKNEAGEPVAALNCGVDCDGGQIGVALRDEKSVRVTIPDGARLWRPGEDDQENADDGRKRFGADDKLFRLDRAAGAECVGLTKDAKTKAMLRRLR